MSKFLFNSALFVEKLLSKEARKANQILDEANKASFEEIQVLRNGYFQNLIQFVYINNIYYRGLMQDHGLTPSEFKSISDLSKLPILTKDIIKTHRNNLASTYEFNTIRRTSGGTTGEPIYIDVDKQARLNELYTYYRGLSWMGYRPGEPMVKLFGGSLGGNNSPTLKNRIKKYVSNELFLPAFDLKKENAEQYLDLVKAKGRTFLQGYVSSIYTLAIYAKELNYKGLNIAGVFTTAEQLPQDQAEFIQSVFGCEVKGFYGCAEMNCLGFQTKMHGEYVIPSEIVYIETNTNSTIGNDNSFLITSLHNRSTPLLRYLNGDTGVLGNKHAKYDTIDELWGRTSDMFRHPNGSYISSIVATQTMQVTGLTDKIKRYQFIQDDIKHIQFKYEPFDNELTRNELNKLESIFQNRFGTDFEITTERTTDFIKSKNKKHRLMINRLKNE